MSKFALEDEVYPWLAVHGPYIFPCLTPILCSPFVGEAVRGSCTNPEGSHVPLLLPALAAPPFVFPFWSKDKLGYMDRMKTLHRYLLVDLRV